MSPGASQSHSDSGLEREEEEEEEEEEGAGEEETDARTEALPEGSWELGTDATAAGLLLSRVSATWGIFLQRLKVKTWLNDHHMMIDDWHADKNNAFYM